MSNNKSPGIDTHPHRTYKNGGQLLKNKVHRLIKGTWREEKVPTDWKTNITVQIYKNMGDKLQCKTTEEYHYYAQDIKYFSHQQQAQQIHLTHNWRISGRI